MSEFVQATRSSRRRVQAWGGALVAVALAAGAGAWYERDGGIEAAAAVATAEPVQVAPRAGVNPESYADLLSKVAPAVVTIRSQQMVQQTQLPFGDDELRRFFGDRLPRQQQPRRASGLGSGVVITEDGYVLTNEHVVSGAQKVVVELGDGRSFEAKIVGLDKPSDLAVLKVPATGLKTLPVGDSDSARVGDVVFAVGNPLGIGQSVTMGIISAKGRVSGGGEGTFEDFIQTDAPINQGNSGGALVNTRGELVGINSQILSPVGYNIGIGFAVPANMARHVMDQLVKSGTVRRGMLGVTVQNITAEMAKSLGLEQTTGAIVSDVQPGSAAAKAGLEQGDVILAVDGKPVDSSNSLRNHVAPLGPEASVKLTLVRSGEKRDVSVTLAELPGERADGRGPRSAAEESAGGHGLSVQPLTPELAKQLGVEEQQGVVVAGVNSEGPAAEAGLQQGDVITQANGKAVTNVGDLRSALSADRGDKPSLLLIVREGRKLFVTMGAARG
ncbi:MAG: DegQ family serine endoprotease [Acidobacteria bacterium]|nr:DegQ family serine endoprotease [Acidobacteriota bacterium]